MAKQHKLSDGSVWPLPDHDNEEGSTGWKLRYQRPVSDTTAFHGASIADVDARIAELAKVLREVIEEDIDQHMMGTDWHDKTRSLMERATK